MTKKLSDVILSPIVTEKSTALSQQNKYTFKVSRYASMTNIKKSFETIFPGRKVLTVQTLKLTGHKRRTKVGFKSPRDLKKAIVTAEGAKIEYFPEFS